MRPRKLALKLLTFVFAFSLFVTLVPTRTTYAFCGPFCIFVDFVRKSFPIPDIRQTIMNSVVTMAIDVPVQFATGRNYDQLQFCMAKLAPNAGIETPTTEPDPEDDCSDLAVVASAASPLGQGRSSGSLMGLASSFQNIAIKEPIPINLAFYAKTMASRIPVVNNTAFAAVETDGTFPLSIVLTVWEKIRNLSYGVLALFMLGIGVMVMLRQKINPQTVVTVQAAIPRIIIAVILITFSYPIAALALQLILPLGAFAVGTLNLAGEQSAVLNTFASYPFSTLVFMLGTLIYAFVTGQGLLTLLLVVILDVALVILVIKIFFGIAMSYVKIIYLALSAPLTFAWGAIPGNEDTTTDWFKSLVVNILSVPAMVFAVGLGNFILINMIDMVLRLNAGATEQLGGFGAFLGVVGGGSVVLLAIPAIVAVIFLEAGKIPAKLEEGIMGRDPKKKKK